MLTGISIDPGFGLTYANGLWRARDDHRMHFLITNVGARPVEMVLGRDSIASVQFFHVPEPSDTQKLQLAGSLKGTTSDNSRLATEGLALFNSIESLKDEFGTWRGKTDTELSRLGDESSSVRRDVDINRSLTDSLLNLGIFVILVTFLAGALGLLLQAAGNVALAQALQSIGQAMPTTLPSAIALVGLLLFLSVVVFSFGRIVVAWITRSDPRRIRQRRTNEDKDDRPRAEQ
jgi:hypothetical protein